MADKATPTSHDKKVVAAIDFGTTYSGYAFAFRTDFERDPLDIKINKWESNIGAEQSPKAPTTALFSPDKQFDAFGYEAEEKYANLIENKEQSDWYYFKRFKMKLYNQMKMKSSFILEDEFGKTMPVQTVFSACIRYMKDHLRTELDQRNPGFPDESIFWVITVPAIWNDSAKQFMRKAANEAGIEDYQLTFGLEPEAAALYCKTLPEGSLSGAKDTEVIECFQPGGKYMILDLGGGTVDTAVHGVREDGSIVEVHKACGGPWGGIKVDDEFFHFVEKQFGPDCVPTLKQTCAYDWNKMEREFEIRKRQVDYISNKNVRLEIPPKIIVNSNKELKDLTSFNKLKVEHEVFRSFFKPSAEHIVKHVEDILKVVPDIQMIFMVGGFSESNYVSQVIREKIPRTRVIVPLQACVSVLKGAVMYGFKPESVAARICRFTYGVRCHTTFEKSKHLEDYKVVIDNEDVCINIFDPLVEEGETVAFNEQRTHDFSSSHKNNNRRHINLEVPVYATKTKKPTYTTDEGCVKLGNVVIHPPDSGWPSKVEFKIHAYFGRTEFSLTVVDATNNQKYEASFDFLD